MSKTLSTILLVPGALTTPACYDLVLPHLQQARFPIAVASLASSNPPRTDECTAATDGQYLVDKHLLPLINDGKDVVLFAHSFGATSLSGAGSNLSKAYRTAKSLPGGVVGIVYISFAMVPDAQSQFDYLRGAWPSFAKPDYISFD